MRVKLYPEEINSAAVRQIREGGYSVYTIGGNSTVKIIFNNYDF